MNPARQPSWSPYTVGALIGGLELISLLTAEKPLGITTPFEEAATLLIAPAESGAAGQQVEINWEWGLVGGVVLGSMLSVRLSGAPLPPPVPDTWRNRFGSSVPLRYGAAALGGALMMFGARMAKGCTSGHGISGTMQLAASSWLFNPIIFSAGAVVARALFGGKHEA